MHEFNIIEVVFGGNPTYEIACYVNGQVKDWFKYYSKQEAQSELQIIFDILNK